MKKIILAMTIVLTSLNGIAQVKTPAPSPKSTVEQMVGLTEVTVEYSRPSKKGRNIFGDLVPFGKLWRTGANKNSIVTFSLLCFNNFRLILIFPVCVNLTALLIRFKTI